MTGLPDLTVLLDDGSGTFPYDISEYVRLVDGYQIVVGRTDEQSDVQPSQLTITLENTDGRFTLGSTVGYASGIYVDQQIRVSVSYVGSYARFTGYVQDWPVTWPGGGDEYATTTITATDDLGRLSRTPLRSNLVEDMIHDGATALYPLNEPSRPVESTGRVAAYDATGTGQNPLSLPTSWQVWPLPTWAATQLPGNENGSAMQLPDSDGENQQTVYQNVMSSRFASSFSPGAYSVEIMFNSAYQAKHSTNVCQLWDSVGTDAVFFMNFNDVAYFGAGWGMICGIGYGTVGAPTDYASVTSNTEYADGKWHHFAAVVSNSGKTLTVYVDGALLGSASMTTPNTAPIVKCRLGIGQQYSKPSYGFYGIYAGVSLTASQVARHAGIALSTWTETSTSAATRILGYVGRTLEITATGSQMVALPAIAGSRVLDVMSQIVASEGGLFYADGDGVLKMQDRQFRAGQGLQNPTVTADDLDPASAFAVDMQHVVNQASVTPASGNTQTSTDQASVSTHGVYDSSLSTLVVSDDDAWEIAKWTTAAHSEPGGRINGAAIDLLTSDSPESFLVVEPSDLLSFSDLPSQAPISGSGVQFVEGWTETLNLSEWTLGVNTSPAAFEQACWILGDSVRGVLGTSTQLHY